MPVSRLLLRSRICDRYDLSPSSGDPWTERPEGERQVYARKEACFRTLEVPDPRLYQHCDSRKIRHTEIIWPRSTITRRTRLRTICFYRWAESTVLISLMLTLPITPSNYIYLTTCVARSMSTNGGYGITKHYKVICCGLQKHLSSMSSQICI